VLRNVLTFPGSEAYQPGVEPAANALAKELAWAGSASSLRTDDGTAVSRTLRMEEGGRRAVMDAATLSRLERTAELVGREVTPTTEASAERSEAEVSCLLTLSGAARAKLARPKKARFLNCIMRLVVGERKWYRG